MGEMQSLIECQGLALTANSPKFGNSEPNQTLSRNHYVLMRNSSLHGQM